MKVKELSLRNYQKIKTLTVQFNQDGDTVITGANESGKTTIANALTWLLTDKPYTGEVNYSPKTRVGDTEMRNAEHSAEALYALEDGSDIRLKKVYKEVYTQKRGTASVEFTGHKTEHFVNGVPVAQNEYSKKVEEIAGTKAEIMRLTVPNHFAEVDTWQDRRSIMIDMVGDVSDQDVIDSDRNLKDLPEYLKEGNAQYTVDDALVVAQQRRKHINDELKQIPARIDEVIGLMPEKLSSKDIAKIKLDADAATKAINQYERAISELRSGTKRSLERSVLSEQLSKAKSKHLEEQSRLEMESSKKIHEAISAENLAIMEHKNAELQLQQARLDHDNFVVRRNELAKRLKETSDEEWQGETTCPTCEREYDSEHINEAKALFNEDKSKRLQVLIDMVKKDASKESLAEFEEAIKASEENLQEKTKALADMTEKKEKAIAEKYIAVDFESTSDYGKIIERIRAAESSKDDADDQKEIDHLMEKIIELQSEIRGIDALLRDQQSLATYEKRIAELEARERELAAQYEREEYRTVLCERFIQAKANMLTDKINKQFDTLSVKMFEEQINGGIKPVCEILIPSAEGALVPYKSANHAGRINAGLEIIKHLSEHYEKRLPVLIDNAEAVNEFYQSDNQLVLFKVTAAGTPLEVSY